MAAIGTFDWRKLRPSLQSHLFRTIQPSIRKAVRARGPVHVRFKCIRAGHVGISNRIGDDYATQRL